MKRKRPAIWIRGNLFADIDNQTWGGSGYFLLILAGPRDVTIDGLGRIFVTDQVLREVRAFGSDGLFLGSIGLAPDVPGGASDSGLQYPHGLEVHGDQLFEMDRLSGMFVYKLGGAP